MFSFYLYQTICLFGQAARETNLNAPRLFHDRVQQTVENMIVQSLIAAVIFVIGLYIILKLRNNFYKPAIESSDSRLNEFRQMYENGEISKEEFRTIKLFLADSLTGSDMEIDSRPKKSEKKDVKKPSREEILKKLLNSEDHNQ